METRLRTYIGSLASAVGVLLILSAAFNWLVDPFAVYGSPSISEFNRVKTECGTNERLAKAYTVARVRPQSICLGSSRALVGIDPDHGGWSFEPVYNLAFSGANMYEILRYFQHANYLQPLREVVLVVDLFSFNTYWGNSPGFLEARLSVNREGEHDGFPPSVVTDLVPTLLSVDALEASLDTIRHQGEPWKSRAVGDNGLLAKKWIPDGQRLLFQQEVRSFLQDTYVPGRFAIGREGTVSTFDYYRQLLRTAYAQGIEVHVVMSPCHAWQWEAVAAGGLWPAFEEWKRLLVVVNQEESRYAGADPFAVWDFGLYNEFTTETVPAAGDAESEMLWYWDSSHYKKELGDLVLDMVFATGVSCPLVLGELGTLLTPENIETHLAHVRSDRAVYRETHPVDAAEIDQIAAETGGSQVSSLGN